MKIPVKIFLISSILSTCRCGADWNKLHEAVYLRKESGVRKILTNPEFSEEQRHSLLNEQDSEGQTPLHTAVLYSTEPIVRIVLAYRASQDIHDKWGWLPIHYAAVDGHIDVLPLLLQHGATTNDLTIAHETPLLIAARNERTPTAEFFLKHCANPNIRANNGWTAMHWAIQSHITPLIRMLLKFDAWLPRPDADGHEPNDYTPFTVPDFAQQYDAAHMRALRELQTFTCCLHDRVGRNSPAHEMLPEIIKHIYWTLKQDYYKKIEAATSSY